MTTMKPCCENLPAALAFVQTGRASSDASEGKGPQRRSQRRVDRRLEEVAKAVGGGYYRLQMPLRLALAVRGTAAGHVCSQFCCCFQNHCLFKIITHPCTPGQQTTPIQILDSVSLHNVSVRNTCFVQGIVNEI